LTENAIILFNFRDFSYRKFGGWRDGRSDVYIAISV